MPDFITRLITQFKDVWIGMDAHKKLLFVTTMVLVVVCVGQALMYSTGSHFVVLYGERISKHDVAAVTAQLQDWNIPYSVQDRTIAVPAKMRDRLSAELAGENLTPSTLPLEIFSDGDYTATKKDREMLYRRAMEGEIIRMLKTLDGIDDVDVNIAWPQKAVNIEDQLPVRASVTLTLEAGITLETKKTAAIVNLLSYSIEGLEADNVYITDQEGTPLVVAVSYDEGHSCINVSS